MARACESHTLSTAIDPGDGQRKKEERGSDILKHELVQLTQHLAERRAFIQVCDRLRVDAVRNQRGADAVPGDITNQEVEVIFVQRGDQTKIAANRACRMVERFNAYAAPDHALWREALLNARREGQIIVDLLLALLEQRVRRAKVVFSGLLFRNIDKRHDVERASIGVFDGPGTGDDGQASTCSCR